MKTATPTISETLAAMDAVDAARNAEELLNEQINIGDRKKILRDKLKATYASNNIVVSDEIIEKGVEDFFANRLVFRRTPRSFNKLVAWCYVKRVMLVKRTALCGLTVGVLIGGWILTGSIAAANKKAAAERQIAAEKAAQAKVIAAQKAEEDKRKAIAAEFVSLTEKIKAVGSTISGIAKEETAKRRNDSLVTEGLGALAAKDLEGGRRTLANLNNLLSQISQEYQIIIQQEPRTVFHRTLDRNPNSPKRYYVIVNAVNNNAPVSIPIKNEESGSVKTTSTWAEQISQQEYDKIKREKETQGVLSDRLMAEKTKGYLQPTYKQGLKVGKGNADVEALRITNW